MAKARTSGQTIAMANGFTIATRDTQPFEAAGAAVVNPWLAE